MSQKDSAMLETMKWMKVQWFKVHSKAKSRLSLTHLYQYNRWCQMLQFIDVINLLDPLLHFCPILFQSVGFRSVLLGGKRSGKMNAGVSFEKVDCPTRSVSRNIALLEDNELATDLTHDRQKLLSQKHLTVVSVIDLHCSIDKNQVYSGPFAQCGHTHGHHYRLSEGRACLQQKFWCNLSLSCLGQRIDTIFWEFLGMAASTRNGNHGKPLNFKYLKTCNIDF